MTQVVHIVQYIQLGIITNNFVMQAIIVSKNRKMQKK